LNSIAEIKVLVVGCGSIGRRHIANLRGLGVTDFVLCDTDPGVLKRASEGLEEPVLETSLEAALERGAHAAVVCTPSSMHIDMALALAERGVHLLIEKPLSHTLERVDELSALVRKKGVVAMMAMCYRFHPVFTRLAAMLEAGEIGRVFHVNYYGGQYLPDWHPKADYRLEYAASKALGGGVVLTTIHGLDDIRRLFGEVSEVRAFVDRVSGLEMDVEDLVMALFKMESGVYVHWQTDYLQRCKQHAMIITGETGTIRCDIAGGTIEVLGAGSARRRSERVEFDINSMYVDEMRHFLDCVLTGSRPAVDVDDGIRTLRLAVEVKEAASSLGGGAVHA